MVISLEGWHRDAKKQISGPVRNVDVAPRVVYQHSARKCAGVCRPTVEQCLPHPDTAPGLIHHLIHARQP